MAGLSYSLPIERFEKIVADGVLIMRKKGATDKEISDFVSTSWERYFAGEFNVTLTFKADRKGKVCATQELACTKTTQANAQ